MNIVCNNEQSRIKNQRMRKSDSLCFCLQFRYWFALPPNIKSSARENRACSSMFFFCRYVLRMIICSLAHSFIHSVIRSFVHASAVPMLCIIYYNHAYGVIIYNNLWHPRKPLLPLICAMRLSRLHPHLSSRLPYLPLFVISSDLFMAPWARLDK